MCDNTDCKGWNAVEYKVILRKEFDYDTCIWCEDCIEKDKDMIDYISTRRR